MKTKKMSAMEHFSQMVMEALQESEKNKTLKWVKPFRTMDTKYRNGISEHEYSGLHNILSCMLSDFSDPRFVTFNQIRKNKWKLKKGSKATRLIAWKLLQKEDEETGKEKTIPLAFNHCLYNLEQVEGHDLGEPSPGLLDEEMKPNTIILDIFKALGVKFDHKPSNRAFYDPQNDSITLPDIRQYESQDQWCGTALHELVHWTSPRVNRNIESYAFDIEDRAFEELVAELGSMFLCMRLKIDAFMDDQSLAYINNWKSAIKGKRGDKFVYKACKLAEEASRFILEGSGLGKEVDSCEPNVVSAESSK